MRRTALILTLVALLLQSCCASHPAHSGYEAVPTAAPSPAAPASAPAAGKSYTVHSANRDLLKVSLPLGEDGPVILSDGALELKSRSGYIFIWHARDATTMDEGIRQAPNVIISEFKDFKPTSTTQLSIPNTPATRLLGSGLEADDDDPGTADVIVFQRDNSFFIACTHGETMRPAAQDLMLKLVQSAATP
jgi:hypothetical protein